MTEEENRKLTKQYDDVGRRFRIRWHFHWNPFRPKECIGGNVYFGLYGETLPRFPGEETEFQTKGQVYIKRNMRIFE